MEDEWEEEEQLVVVELSGVISNDFLSQCQGTCSILDIDSEKPMMQVGPYVFVGEYEDALGTCVLFEEESNNGDAGEGPADLKYKGHTVKRLKMQRIFLTEKKDEQSSTGCGQNDAEALDSVDSSSKVNLSEPAGNTADDPADDPTDDTADDPADDPADDTTDDPADVPADDPTDDTADDPADDTTDDPGDD